MLNSMSSLIAEAINSLRNRNYADAELFLKQAITLDPNNPEILRLLGILEANKKNYDSALNIFQKALELSPTNALIVSNIGNIYFEQKNFSAALKCFLEAINLNQDYAEAHSNLGNVYQELRRFDDAIQSYNRAIAIDPKEAKFYLNMGNSFAEVLRLQDALDCYENAAQLEPNYYLTYWHMSLVLLLSGNFSDGLKLYESRLADADEFCFTGKKRSFSKPQWTGSESLEGKSIFICCEQGLGDTLQFCRYLKLVSKLGANVIFEIPRPLFHLFKDLEGVSTLIIEGDDIPAFDYHCPLLSLPLVFKTDLNSIPAELPYLKSDSVKFLEWQKRLGQKVKPRIGLTWSSTSNYKNDAKRSMQLSEFIKALPDEDYEFICLQKELKQCDKDLFKSFRKIRFYGDYLRDLSDTAALIDCVDLVISTCTSIPHLSAALGKKTWLLLSFSPDWRWLLGRSDSPWYPSSMQLFRQEKLDDWRQVLKEVRESLPLFFCEM